MFDAFMEVSILLSWDLRSSCQVFVWILLNVDMHMAYILISTYVGHSSEVQLYTIVSNILPGSCTVQILVYTVS